PVAVAEGEVHQDIGQAEQRNRLDHLDVRDALHRRFDRDGVVALDLLGALATGLGDDLDERRHRVRIGLDVEVQEADQAGAEYGDEKDDDEDTLLYRKGNDAVHIAALIQSGTLTQTKDPSPSRHWPLFGERNHVLAV